MQYKLLH